jgi:hypothetical protein
MNQFGRLVLGAESKIFDPRDPSTGSGGAELLDATVVRRAEQWWMYLAGQTAGYGPTGIYSASLDRGAPLSATGWKLSWHSGPWKPSLAFHEQDAARALVFFDGLYRTSDPGPFPFAFTLGCLEAQWAG